MNRGPYEYPGSGKCSCRGCDHYHYPNHDDGDAANGKSDASLCD